MKPKGLESKRVLCSTFLLLIYLLFMFNCLILLTVAFCISGKINIVLDVKAVELL